MNRSPATRQENHMSTHIHHDWTTGSPLDTGMRGGAWA